MKEEKQFNLDEVRTDTLNPEVHIVTLADSNSSEPIHPRVQHSLENEELSFCPTLYEANWNRLCNEDLLASQSHTLCEEITGLTRERNKIWITECCSLRPLIHSHIALKHPVLEKKLAYLSKFEIDVAEPFTLKRIVDLYRK